MSVCKRFFCLAVFVLSLVGVAPFQATADDIFYCYEDFYWSPYFEKFYGTSYTLNREDRKLIVRYGLSSHDPYYSVSFNLTQKKIGYVDIWADTERWVDIENMESQGNLLVLTSSMVVFSEILPILSTLYFDRETLNYTELWRSFSDSDEVTPIPLEFGISAGRCQTEEMQ